MRQSAESFKILNAHFPNRILLLRVSEACLVSLAFLVADTAQLRTSIGALLLGHERGALKILLISAAFIISMHYFDLYDASILVNRHRVRIRLLEALITADVFLALLYLLYPPLGLGRPIFIIGSMLVVVLLLLWRNLFSIINKLPHFAERALIYGQGPLVEPLVEELESRPELGLLVVGRLARTQRHGDMSDVAIETIESENLSRAVENLHVSRIVVAMGERRGNLPVELLLSLKCRGVRIHESTEVYEAITGKVPIESIRLSSLLFSPGCGASRSLAVLKRLVDIFVSVVGLVISALLLPFAMLAIRLTSPGPIFYHQKRVGRDGTAFDCYKLRTMRADAEADTGPTWATDDDPRITVVGKFLRQSRIDEIPQLWNVLRGDMSIVGPRPERPEFVESLTRHIPYYSLRHSIRPGITGWAQVWYKYGNSLEDTKEKLRYDLFYIRNMSIGLDLLIFFSTVKVMLLQRGAK
jgi:sugar transferase (PEP-CTERM system associated)